MEKDSTSKSDDLGEHAEAPATEVRPLSIERSTEV